MSKHLSVIAAAAALAVGGIGFSTTLSYADDAKTTADKAGTAADHAADRSDKAAAATTQPSGTTAAPDVDDIRKTLATVTEAAVTKGGFDDVTERFVDADRDRLKEAAKQNYSDLDGRIDQFLKDWKAKYNQDFKLSGSRNDILNDQFARITQGEIPGEAHTAGSTIKGAGEAAKDAVTPGSGAKTEPGPNGGTEYKPKDGSDTGKGTGTTAGGTNPKGPGGQADLDKSGATKTDANSGKTGGGDTNRDPGRNVAAAVIPASHGMPEIAVPLIHEMPDSWRIDLPDNVDGAKLHDSLLKHLTMVDEHKDQWPSDVNEAYRMVTHHVMAALFEPAMHDHAGGGGAMPPAAK